MWPRCQARFAGEFSRSSDRRRSGAEASAGAGVPAPASAATGSAATSSAAALPSGTSPSAAPVATPVYVAPPASAQTASAGVSTKLAKGAPVVVEIEETFDSEILFPRQFSFAVVGENVKGPDGGIAIPSNSPALLIVRDVGKTGGISRLVFGPESGQRRGPQLLRPGRSKGHGDPRIHRRRLKRADPPNGSLY